MLRALLALALAGALLPAPPAGAHRLAPSLREDEPARRTTRPAGESTATPVNQLKLNST